MNKKGSSRGEKIETNPLCRCGHSMVAHGRWGNGPCSHSGCWCNNPACQFEGKVSVPKRK